MANELKDFLVKSQWKQDKPESHAVKQAHYNRMMATIKRAVDRVGNFWKR
jgi:hypothetical protein